MGRKGPRAITKTVLKSVSKWAQFGSMQNLKFQTLQNKNHPTHPPTFGPIDPNKTIVFLGWGGASLILQCVDCDLKVISSETCLKNLSPAMSGQNTRGQFLNPTFAP